MHSSLNTGRFLLGMDCAFNSTGINELASSVLTDLAVWDIDASGHYRAVSGTTVKMRFGADGLFAGGNTSMLIDPAKGYQINTQRVTVVAAATTQVDMTSVDSGVLFYLSTQLTDSTKQIFLPATPAVGSFYDIFADTTGTGDITILGAATGDVQGFHYGESSNVFFSTGGFTNVTSGVFYVRCTALTSVGLYAVQTLNQSFSTATMYGRLANATTTT